jgi:hypothetical protein
MICFKCSSITAQPGISGTIPQIEHLSALQQFRVSACQLSGTIPTLPSGLTIFNVGDNRLSVRSVLLSRHFFFELKTFWLLFYVGNSAIDTSISDIIVFSNK